MRLTRWNGEHWYHEDRSIARRLLRWFVWSGGVAGDRTPFAILGHRLTFFGWGWQVRLGRHGYLVRSETSGLYISRDGTPSSAHVWIKGTPRDVEQAADEHAQRLREYHERRREMA